MQLRTLQTWFSLAMATLAACGSDDPDDALDPAVAAGGSMNGAPQGAPSSGGAGSAGPGATPNGMTCTAPPHTAAAYYQAKCQYACEKGYADCDGDLANGCEVSLGTPEACRSCPAMACTRPDLCGLPERQCEPFEGLRWSLPGGASERLPSLASGPMPGQVYATTTRYFDENLDTGLPLPTGGLFELALKEKGGFVWTADADSGDAGRVRRVGDRLYFTGTLSETAVLVVADLQGKLIWTRSIGAMDARFCAHDVAADEAHSVYFAFSVCEGEYRVGGRTYGDLRWGGAERIVVAFDGEGNERWRTVPLDDSHSCWAGARPGFLDFRVVGSKLIAVNQECLFEIDRTSGERVREQTLYAMAERGALASDAEGNLYVAGSSTYNYSLPHADAVTPGQAPGSWPYRPRLFVSKYTPDLKHVWTRPLAYGSTSFIAFDVGPTGAGYLVATEKIMAERERNEALLVSFDNEGRATAAGHFLIGDEPSALVLGADGLPYVGGKYRNEETSRGGLFIGTTAFTRQAM